ncbi:MAG: hypothetical protein MZV70_09890 [Desulfobacterales bacterium]|nr:hypothetical protein [Desulfobacterales bacterium]
MAQEKIIHYPNGAVKEKKYLLEGKMDGEYTTYFPGGQVMAQLHFVNGKETAPPSAIMQTGRFGKK